MILQVTRCLECGSGRLAREPYKVECMDCGAKHVDEPGLRRARRRAAALLALLNVALISALVASALFLSGCAAPPECWRVSSVDTWAQGTYASAEAELALEGRRGDLGGWDAGGGVNLHWEASACGRRGPGPLNPAVPGGSGSPAQR